MIEIAWADEKGAHRKIIYTSQFSKCKTMDDLFRFAGIPVFQKYTILNAFEVLHPWSNVVIMGDMEIVDQNRKKTLVKMKRLYGS